MTTTSQVRRQSDDDGEPVPFFVAIKPVRQYGKSYLQRCLYVIALGLRSVTICTGTKIIN